VRPVPRDQHVRSPLNMHDSTVEDQWLSFEAGGHVVRIRGPDTGALPPVGRTCSSDCSELGCSESPTALFHGGSYLSPMAGSSSLS
jgi:hypothetical protein